MSSNFELSDVEYFALWNSQDAHRAQEAMLRAELDRLRDVIHDFMIELNNSDLLTESDELEEILHESKERLP